VGWKGKWWPSAKEPAGKNQPTAVKQLHRKIQLRFEGWKLKAIHAGAKSLFGGWVRGKRIRDSPFAVYTAVNFLPALAFNLQPSTARFVSGPALNAAHIPVPVRSARNP